MTDDEESGLDQIVKDNVSRIAKRKRRSSTVKDGPGSERGVEDEVLVLESLKDEVGSIKNFMKKIDRKLEGLLALKDEVANITKMVEKVWRKVGDLEERCEKMEERVAQSDQNCLKVEEIVQGCQKELQKSQEAYRVLEERSVDLEDKVIDQEARSRRNNLIFHGVPESPGEDCFKIVSDIIVRGCKINDPFVIERSHRLGGPVRTSGRQSGQTKPRPLIARFLDYTMKERVRNCRRELAPEVTVTEDLPWQIRQARGSLKAAADEAKKSSRDVWVSYPARLMVDGKCIKSVRPAKMKRQFGGQSQAEDENRVHAERKDVNRGGVNKDPRIRRDGTGGYQGARGGDRRR